MASQATLNLFDLLIKAVDPQGYVDMSAIQAARADLELCDCGATTVEGHKVEIEVDATPAATELADKLGVSVEQIEGTGKGGRVTKPDVEAAADGDDRDDVSG